MEPEDQSTFMRAALDLAGAVGEAQWPHPEPGTGTPYQIVPEGMRLDSLEHLLPAPLRIRQRVALRTAESFVAYCTRFSTTTAACFGDDKAFRIDSILDFHVADAPSHCTHRARLQLEHSDEWKTWLGGSHKPMSQVVFSRFLEDNLPDIVSPDGATVLEVAQTLEAVKKVAFRSAVRLSNGERQFLYEETITEGAAKGALKVPEVFTLGLRPFVGLQAYRCEARLRYRIEDEGKLALWFEIVRPHLVLDAAFAEVLAEISEGLRGAKIFLGSAD